jgi:nifR3 family TIM-barrel protein
MSNELARYLNRSLTTGNRRIPGRLVLAPMSGLGHVAFRELVAGFGGAGILFGEMCSARGILHENRHVSTHFKWRDEERGRLVLQIYGDEPEVMAAAAARIEAENLFGVDINFGCAASAICRRNCGAALLKNPPAAQRIVAAVRKAVSIPLFVKFRTGWRDDPQAAVAMARRFESAGADALTFHPRVAPDRRARQPRWDYIRQVKAAVSIPVFGNGNVFAAEDCLRMIRQTGCDGVALGRLAAARPWIFAAWTKGAGYHQPEPGAPALDLAALLVRHFDPAAALGRFKKFIQYYAANFRFGHVLFKSVRTAQAMPAATAAVSAFLRTDSSPLVRPNRNLMV